MAKHFLESLLGPDGATAMLVRAAPPAVVARRIETAFDSASRTRGLLGRASLDPDTAMIIAPCSAVHTFKMQFAIDLIYVARDGRVLKTRTAVPPGRMSMCIGAFAVIEMAAGSIARGQINLGDRIIVTPQRSGVRSAT